MWQRHEPLVSPVLEGRANGCSGKGRDGREPVQRLVTHAVQIAQPAALCVEREPRQASRIARSRTIAAGKAMEFNIKAVGSPSGPRTYAATDDGSEINFVDGGNIVSKTGFAIEVLGSSLTMTPGGIELAAPLISLSAETIAIEAKGKVTITAGGAVIVSGAIIKLN